MSGGRSCAESTIEAKIVIYDEKGSPLVAVVNGPDTETILFFGAAGLSILKMPSFGAASRFIDAETIIVRIGDSNDFNS